MTKQKGITASKDNDFSEWYTQVIQKADLIEYTDVSGCYILKPRAYAIWEKLQEFFNKELKKRNIKNAYFPLLIPEHLLMKEKEHVKGFSPEVAWVTHSGDTKLAERLAVRPTSETIMYDAYAKWIRSHNDLPLKLNQWCNVVRWEFKNPVPFLRSREFLWQEGHTVFATKKEAEIEVYDILSVYKRIFEELYAVPVIEGTKSVKEKFAGADFTTSVETFLPSGKAIQGATSHHLGQNFSKAFDITFLDKDSNKQYAWQNSWGITTRSIGIMIMMHSDDKGLVLPPRVAPTQIVIVPIVFEDSKKNVLNKVKEIAKQLKSLNVEIDDRDNYSPGWKFNEWEMKGIPIRIEIGPKDVSKNQAVLVRRDTGEKKIVKISEIKTIAPKMLDDIQKNLFNKAKKFMDSNIVEVENFKDFVKAIKDKKMVKAQWCNNPVCEEKIKDKMGGAKSLNIPFVQLKISGKCVCCDEKAKVVALFAKSY
ncbi:MAG: proline--tRNA ligase [Nanoarchaeota archaeon]|nr:proline--tRNA ligase [Nanoarchaeota archaeon]